MSSNIEIKKKCRWCGSEFIARKTSTEYCSHRCSGLAYKERKRQSRLESYQQEYEHQQSVRAGVATQEFLTPTQAAKLLGVCHMTIYNYINQVYQSRCSESLETEKEDSYQAGRH